MPFPSTPPSGKFDWDRERQARGEQDARPARSPDVDRESFEREHLCVDCGRLTVCEIGRATVRAFVDGWLTVISRCNQFEPGADAEESIDAKP